MPQIEPTLALCNPGSIINWNSLPHYIDCWKMYCSTLIYHVFSGIVSLTLNTIDVPAHRVVGDRATLICQFDMEGDTLYSVKWYKDDREFYRFVPNDRPRLQVFDTQGIQVDVSYMF